MSSGTADVATITALVWMIIRAFKGCVRPKYAVIKYAVDMLNNA